MKFKNLEIVTYMNFLTNVSNKKLPQKINYAIARNLRSFKGEYDLYFESLNKLLDTYKDSIIKDEDGNPVMYNSGIPKVEKSVEDEYFKEINDLFNIEVDVKLYKVSEDVFDYENEKYDILSPMEIMTLIELIGEEPDKEDK